MGLDEGLSIEEEEKIREANLTRVLELVSLAKHEKPNGFYPVDKEDFFDLFCNCPGYILSLNEPYCLRYFKHEMDCFSQGFSCVTDNEIAGIVEF